MQHEACWVWRVDEQSRWRPRIILSPVGTEGLCSDRQPCHQTSSGSRIASSCASDLSPWPRLRIRISELLTHACMPGVKRGEPGQRGVRKNNTSDMSRNLCMDHESWRRKCQGGLGLYLDLSPPSTPAPLRWNLRRRHSGSRWHRLG